MNREAIYSALFTLVSGAAPVSGAAFKTKSRRVRLWSDVGQGEQPALFMGQGTESCARQTNQPARWTLNVELYLYAHTQDSKTAPAAVLNPLLDAVTAVLEPATGEVQTLGGMVQYARISGGVETDEGRLGDQAVAIIPIEILV